MKPEYFVLGLFFIDMLFSYFYIKRFRERHPDKDWSVVEANPLLRYNIKTFGLEKGMIIGSIMLLTILGIILVYANNNFKFFLIGVYFMVNVQHVVNWNSLRFLDKQKGGTRNGKKNK